MSIQAQIDHMEASIIGIENAIEANKGRKRPDDMDAFRQIRLDGFRAVLKTLQFSRDNEPLIREAIQMRDRLAERHAVIREAVKRGRE